METDGALLEFAGKDIEIRPFFCGQRSIVGTQVYCLYDEWQYELGKRLPLQ